MRFTPPFLVNELWTPAKQMGMLYHVKSVNNAINTRKYYG